MKLTSGFFLLVFLLLSMTCCLAAGITLVTEENPPFNYTESGKPTGATTAVVREITRRLGIAGDIQVMPWTRGYKLLSSEPNVVLFTTALTQKREPLFQWVGPLYTVRLGFYARKSDARRIDSLEAAKQVGAIATYKDDFREQLLTSLGFTNLDSSKSPQSNLRKLMSGRVDLWFYDNIGPYQVAREVGIDPNEIEEVFTYQQHFSYIAISKQTSPVIVQQWQATLDEMKADGTFWWLTRKWLPPEAIMVSERQTSTDRPFPLKLYTEDSPPSSYKEKGQIKGLSTEIVQEILRRIGQPDTISLVPWARGYKLVQSDAGTALFSTTRLPQREALFSWVGPLYRQRWGFYRWKGSGIDVPDIEAAKKVDRIGTYHQDAKMQYLQALGFENLVPTNKNISNVTHLKKGNIDLWVSSDFNVPYLADQAGVSAYQLELAFAFHRVGNYIAFSKATSPHVIRLWQAVLDEMKADGSYQRICRTYNYEPQ
ncbi:ABC transporter substrate-binding protein [uncultured Desulfosarcina sp.]|uniref:substrate-binding periplasmic protein n=1 Tax=uncultured Desulfosarcina sp. TaxID=218289 RepID=UPI0029C7B095|nr:ABC transporter substrate-binding protein [uncultured Desulfosarcina sp.]